MQTFSRERAPAATETLRRARRADSSAPPANQPPRFERPPLPDAQRTAGNQAVQRALLQAGEVVRSPGKPLDPVIQFENEQRMGIDLSRVRIHDDEAAAA